ncbi:MAG: exo-alpha-sialidase [Thermoguttaceae bacterium]|nr:exo-alpha-sialidase [Thermoguttaceae bacterium]MBQ3821441.1 exo-alpha-sialidase [Thermoguttaceae bacterium]
MSPLFRQLVPLLLAAFLSTQPLAPVRAQEADPLAPPPVLRPVPEKYSDANRAWQGIASLEVARDGGLWACWYSGGKTECGENYVLVAYSGDRGETWTEPIMAVDPVGIVRAFDATMWSDPDGKLWLFWSQGEESKFNPSIWDGRVGVWAMTTTEPEKGADAQWSAPRRLCNGIMMCKPIADSQGRWLFPVSIWRFDSKYKLDEKLRGANVYISTDRGATLDFYGRVEVPRDVSVFDEHNIVERKDGSFLILNRTTRGIGESVSTDGAKTWTPFAESKIKHTSSRFFVRRLRSGALLLVKNGPIDQDVGRSRMTAFVSDDDGATWQGGLVLDERDAVSYPDGGQADDGTVFIAYDRDRYGEREIYCARFTEEDVRAGKLVSESGKLRLLVNKATGPK